VPFRKRRSLAPVQRESVNSSRPEFLPMMRPVRAPDRDQARPTISNRKAPLSAGLLFNSSFVPPHALPLHLSPSDGLHIEAALASANTNTKLVHAVDVLCIDYYEACQRKNRANSWNDCHSRVEVHVSTASAEKNMLGFRARASRISSLASGRILFSSCGADPSRAQTGCRPLQHAAPGGAVYSV
jgi:hypothetical protein